MDRKRTYQSTMERSTLLLVALVSIGSLLLGGFAFVDPKVFRPKAGGATRGELVINGDRDADYVVFDHARHQKDLGGKDGCARCHHLRMPADFNTACFQCHSGMDSPAKFFDHATHQQRLGENQSCEKCHQPLTPKSSEFIKDCADCHADDIGLKSGADGVTAPSYVDAMHGLCENCHLEQKPKAGTENLAACDNCHLNVKHQPEERER